MDESTKNRIKYCGTMVNVQGKCIMEDLHRQTPEERDAKGILLVHNRVIDSLQRDYNVVYLSLITDNCSTQQLFRQMVLCQYP